MEEEGERGRKKKKKVHRAPLSSSVLSSPLSPLPSPSLSWVVRSSLPGGNRLLPPLLSSLIRNHFRRRILNFKRADRTDGQTGMQQQRRRRGKGWQSSMITPIFTKSTRTGKNEALKTREDKIGEGKEEYVSSSLCSFLASRRVGWRESVSLDPHCFLPRFRRVMPFMPPPPPPPPPIRAAASRVAAAAAAERWNNLPPDSAAQKKGIESEHEKSRPPTAGETTKEGSPFFRLFSWAQPPPPPPLAPLKKPQIALVPLLMSAPAYEVQDG